MISVMKCLYPTNIAVERANGYHVFAESHGRSLCVVAIVVGRWSSSMVTSLFWHSAIVGLPQSLKQFSSSRGRLIWFQESLAQQCAWSKEHLEEYFVS